MRKLFGLISFVLLSGYSESQVIYPTRIKGNSGSIVNAKLKGVWKSIGDGYILDARDKEIILYSYTSRHCYAEENDYLADLLNNSATFSVNRTKDTVSFYLQDFGTKTKLLQPERKYYKLDKLPGNCGGLTAEQRNDPEFLFELVWLTLKENYAFAKERHVNWDRIYRDYKPKVTPQTTKDELFNLLGEIVTLTKDQHTKIISKAGQTRQYSGVPSALLLKKVFDQQNDVKDFKEYINNFFKTNYENISGDLLKGNGRKDANGKIEWGNLTPGIGYIHIHSLTGFAPDKLPRKQHLDTLNFYMTRIIKSLRYKKAIIVDLSFNFGGYDAAGLTISGYFTNKPVQVYTRHSFQEDSFNKGSAFTVYPAPKYRFTNPVYVVTTDITRSAAETFAMQMKALPNSKIVGTNTLGILSDMLGKSIGDYYLTLSNEKYVSPTGEMYEVKGIDVDVPLKIFTKDNMFNGHRDAIKKIVEIIERGD